MIPLFVRKIFMNTCIDSNDEHVCFFLKIRDRNGWNPSHKTRQLQGNCVPLKHIHQLTIYSDIALGVGPKLCSITKKSWLTAQNDTFNNAV